MAPGVIASVLAEGVEGVLAPSKRAGAPIAAQAIMEEVGALGVILKDNASLNTTIKSLLPYLAPVYSRIHENSESDTTQLKMSV